MKSLTLCHLMLIFFCANILAAQQSDNSKNTERSTATAIEVMTVSHSKTIKSLDDVRTSDNVLIYPEQIFSAKHTVADLISQSAGVNLNGQGGLFQSLSLIHI